MTNVIVAGAAGRMGCRLVALIKDSNILTLAGALEGTGHGALLAMAGGQADGPSLPLERDPWAGAARSAGTIAGGARHRGNPYLPKG